MYAQYAAVKRLLVANLTKVYSNDSTDSHTGPKWDKKERCRMDLTNFICYQRYMITKLNKVKEGSFLLTRYLCQLKYKMFLRTLKMTSASYDFFTFWNITDSLHALTI